MFGGNFNLIFDCKFGASGGNPIFLEEISSESNSNKKNSLLVRYLENKKS